MSYSLPRAEKIYLGDSVYAEDDGYYVWLTTNNGYTDDPRNKIALKPAVLHNLGEYMKEVARARQARPDEAV